MTKNKRQYFTFQVTNPEKLCTVSDPKVHIIASGCEAPVAGGGTRTSLGNLGTVSKVTPMALGREGQAGLLTSLLLQRPAGQG